MPRARTLNSYPDELWQIVEGAALRNEKFTVPCADWRDAARFQGQFYAFRGALRRELDALTLRPDSELHGWRQRVEQTLRQCEKVVCWFDRTAGGDPHVVYMSKGQTPHALALRKVLSQGQVSAPDDAIAASAARIMEQTRKGN
jgi:hypothetical protein